MIKVLIADDEPKLREGLRSIIPWEELGFSVVATAANGLQALEKYHTYYPELLVVDIRMPGMDGLELIRELRSEGSTSHVLILSGHADFDYAKQAISHRVDGYLLKPVDEDEMIQYLEQLRETISQEDKFSKWTEGEPARNREMLLRELLQPSTAQDEVHDPGKFVAALGLENGNYEVVLISLRESAAAGDDKLTNVKEALMRHFAHKGNGLFFTMPPYMGILLNNPLFTELDRKELYNELAGIMEREGFRFRVAAGGAVTRPEAAFVSFTTARELLQRAFFADNETMISAETFSRSIEDKEKSGEVEDGAENGETRLLLAVETGSTSMIRPLVSVIIDELTVAGADELRVKETFVHILSTVLVRLEPTYPEIRTYAAENSPPIGELYHSYCFGDLQEQVVAFLTGIAGRMNSGGRGNEIKQITELIQRRYNENLKLETLAELFNYNSAYLGKMFKSTTGEYFNTYVDKVRIEKAKQFLAQGMKVYEVAEKVGYMNPDYFNAKFRKYVGASPSSYRKGN
ncbi:response regulator [Paenibacillus sp. sgz500958]|uniref:response regulator n=1 Tax=Paenibacillus sp. sgz500958 TaxID=3242475 RepID=UPI0036D2CF0A